MDLDLIRSLAVPGTTKIVLLSADGLGGFPDPATGLSELETARIPHLDALARRGACGLLRHVAPGITPGSGPGHLGLFGYEPLRYPVGRGVLEALGIDFDLRPGDVAARGNFCTLDAAGRITRSPGRPDLRRSGAPRWWSGCAGSGCRESSSSSSRSRSTGSSWCCAGPGCRATCPRPTPRPSASRPCPCTRRPRRPRDGRHRQPVRRGGPAPPGRRRAGEHGAPARLRPAAGPARASRRCTASGRRRSPPTRCTAGSPAWSAWTCSRPAARSRTR